ncbi:hypothetical protein CEXT_249251 [Caerostris extrusa]|uniref:Uncharacterized protein n=1 Tax=Caerostris extrusa TaxID=172846 RepID=A0AAV4SIJ0_CAEEX|nr:hypothetical protein CEXT_249251 [Caerostris extrusa]
MRKMDPSKLLTRIRGDIIVFDQEKHRLHLRIESGSSRYGVFSGNLRESTHLIFGLENRCCLYLRIKTGFIQGVISMYISRVAQIVFDKEKPDRLHFKIESGNSRRGVIPMNASMSTQLLLA